MPQPVEPANNVLHNSGKGLLVTGGERTVQDSRARFLACGYGCGTGDAMNILAADGLKAADFLAPADDRRLAQARERFLTGEPIEPGQVRETILASWRRSLQWRVAADRIDLSYVRDPDL